MNQGAHVMEGLSHSFSQDLYKINCGMKCIQFQTQH